MSSSEDEDTSFSTKPLQALLEDMYDVLSDELLEYPLAVSV